MPYDPEMSMYVSGARGNDPGSFVDVPHHHLAFLIRSAVHNVQPTFRSKRLLEFKPPIVAPTNKNLTAAFTLNYETSSAISNIVSFTYGMVWL